jgi:hypothetical protein
MSANTSDGTCGGTAELIRMLFLEGLEQQWYSYRAPNVSLY